MSMQNKDADDAVIVISKGSDYIQVPESDIEANYFDKEKRYNAIDEKNAFLEKQLVEKDNEIAKMKDELREKDESMTMLKNEINQLQHKYTTNVNLTKKEIDEKEAQITMIKSKLDKLKQSDDKENKDDVKSKYLDSQNQLANMDHIILQLKKDYVDSLEKKHQQLEEINSSLIDTIQRIEEIVYYMKHPPEGKLDDDNNFELTFSRCIKGHIDICYYGELKSTHKFDTKHVSVKFSKEGEYQITLYMNFPFANGVEQAVAIKCYNFDISSVDESDY
jgi:hypothetical protein